MPTTTHTAPASAPPMSSQLPLAVGGALAALLIILLLLKGTGSKASLRRLDPQQVERAKKRYTAAMDKRLGGKVDQYSVLLDARNMVSGFYEQRGQITGARFTVKQANCRRCKALDGKEFSLLDPAKLAAVTPPLHGEVRRGVHCVAAMVPIRAEADRPKAKAKA